VKHKRTATWPLAGAALLIGLFVLGSLATLLSVRTEQDAARLRDARAAEVVASRLSGALQRTVAALRGADALAVDGSVSADEFAAFARDIVDGSLYRAIAFAQVVDGDDRAAFEARTGLTIRDTDGKGGLVTSPPRDQYEVVTEVYPQTDQAMSLRGFDIASDPTRRDAAQRSLAVAGPVVSDRISLADSGRPGVFVVQDVQLPDGTSIGFLSSGIAIDSLVESAGISPGTDFQLSLDGMVLAGSDGGGEARDFDVAGRTFVVDVDDPDGVDLSLPAVIGASTILLAVGVVLAYRRDRRQTARLAATARRNRGIAALGQRLAGASSVRAVLSEVLALAPTILAADQFVVVRRAPDEPALFVTERGVDLSGVWASHAGPIRATETSPLADTLRTKRAVSVPTATSLAQQYPDLATAAGGQALRSLACVPLVFADDVCVGAIGFGWSHDLTTSELDQRLVAADTIGELASRALERAVINEVVQAGAGHLSAFAQDLARAHTAAEVQTAVRQHVPLVVNARSAELAGAGDAADGIVNTTVVDVPGQPGQCLRLRWIGSQSPSPTQNSVLQTLTELVGQTLARTSLTEQEHQLIVQLQQDVLDVQTTFDGLEIAVTYRPAMRLVGIGGDFYDVITSDLGRLYVVIGDVSGHGTEAVTVMAELRAVINHLLRSGTPLESVCAQLDVLLARRKMFATAQIVEVDRARNELRYINAGHPYPMLRRARGGTQPLRDGHRALLGLVSHRRAAVLAAGTEFLPGDELVLYTDGLIERRAEPLDEGMRLLAEAIDTAAMPTMSELLRSLLDRIATLGASDKVDDDIAIVGVRSVAMPPSLPDHQ
jgi:serine phosphatase RsbU (regulator of sigma subunit)/sensor domain CHASE-containing protein